MNRIIYLVMLLTTITTGCEQKTPKEAPDMEASKKAVTDLLDDITIHSEGKKQLT